MELRGEKGKRRKIESERKRREVITYTYIPKKN